MHKDNTKQRNKFLVELLHCLLLIPRLALKFIFRGIQEKHSILRLLYFSFRSSLMDLYADKRGPQAFGTD